MARRIICTRFLFNSDTTIAVLCQSVMFNKANVGIRLPMFKKDSIENILCYITWNPTSQLSLHGCHYQQAVPDYTAGNTIAVLLWPGRFVMSVSDFLGFFKHLSASTPLSMVSVCFKGPLLAWLLDSLYSNSRHVQAHLTLNTFISANLHLRQDTTLVLKDLLKDTTVAAWLSWEFSFNLYARLYALSAEPKSCLKPQSALSDTPALPDSHQ